MKYLLDTNACIQYLNRRSTRLRERIEAAGAADIVVCSIVKAELFFGAAKSASPEKTLARQKAFVERFDSFPFDDQAGEVYARLRAEIEHAGTPIGSNDLLIAAIATAHDLILVSHNTSEFQRVPGLRVEDWEAEL